MGDTGAVSAAEHLQPRQFVRRMQPSELLPFAKDRTSNPTMNRNVDDLAKQITSRGYRPGSHGGMSGDPDSYPPSEPITLVHDKPMSEGGWGSYVAQGNHRVAALNRANYPKSVPVLVRDLR